MTQFPWFLVFALVLTVNFSWDVYHWQLSVMKFGHYRAVPATVARAADAAMLPAVC